MILPLLTFDIQYYILFIQCSNLWNIFFVILNIIVVQNLIEYLPIINKHIFISPDGREI